MEIVLLIFGMFFVTYIPRMIPVLIHDIIILPNWANNWLKSIPYAALGTLIFPGIININKEKPIAGIVCGIVAAVVAYLELNIGYVIGVAILVSVAMLHLI